MGSGTLVGDPSARRDARCARLRRSGQQVEHSRRVRKVLRYGDGKSDAVMLDNAGG
jgi:tyrosyl-tRNA synthetase